MKLSARARNAVRLMLEVHRRGGRDRPVKVGDVSKATGVSPRFLGQVAMSLKTHGLLRGVCGRNGGYLLGRRAEEITVGDVLRAVIGPIDIAVCAADENVCVDGEVCETSLMWRLLRQHIHALLDAHTVADLACDQWKDRVQGELLDFEGLAQTVGGPPLARPPAAARSQRRLRGEGQPRHEAGAAPIARGEQIA
ncbi:MAG: Rrf2 family transcriptional regulator [Deltaproteobacteria bacterium]|jgi:Rrf2 family protein|nr:Rrf2 family transcriptional regulator [Deltaproteobacteria bacterium]MBW2536933.1 Rrf2 family transcriptional regulator [Deltaproteobacteria bacterium]